MSKRQKDEDNMPRRHKVFLSYHHANDQSYKNIFELRFGNKFNRLISGSVRVGDIDPSLSDNRIRQKIRDEYLRDTSVTVVLIGTQTWQRKHVDWEISSSIRNTRLNPRAGLLGIFLPTHPSYGNNSYDHRTIPPRLYDNVDCEYAILADWSNDPDRVQELVRSAYLRKRSKLPDNSRDLFRRNRSGAKWR